jgi:hypothetical protein
MLFSLEVVQAKHGDCLLLHFGKKTDPKIIVIDGGPSGVYDNFLKPRLLKIKEQNAPNDALPISMIMVSHMDDDHANGICMLTDEIVQDGNTAKFEIDHLWINTFDDIVGNDQLLGISAIGASSIAASVSSLGIPGLQKADHETAALIASTAQGRQLRDNAKSLSVTLNQPFKKLSGKAALVRGDTKESVVNWEGLKLTVVSPSEIRLETLQKQWDKDLKKAKAAGDNSIIISSLTALDTSPFNVSSIACLVELNSKTILLTGDGRSDDIYAGLKKNKLLDSKGKIHVDILKLPHHGSIRNMEKSFLENVTAEHYVISADGSNDNPDKPLLDLFVTTVSTGKLYLTNKTGKKDIKKNIDAFLKKLKTKKSKLVVIFPEAGRNTMLIDLLESVDF